MAQQKAREAPGGIAAPPGRAVASRNYLRSGVRIVQRIDIIPGIGVGGYGGFYYEGDHEFNLAGRLARHPDAAGVDDKGRASARPAHT